MPDTSALTHQMPPLPFAVGDVFPDIILPTIDTGEPLSLTVYRGKKLLLHIFASW